MRTKSTEWPITRNQLRAARILARLGMRELSKLSRISTTTITHIESGKSQQPHVRTLERLRDVLESQGVEFVPGGWVRLRDDHEHQGGESEGEPIEQSAVIDKTRALARRLVRVLGG